MAEMADALTAAIATKNTAITTEADPRLSLSFIRHFVNLGF